MCVLGDRDRYRKTKRLSIERLQKLATDRFRLYWRYIRSSSFLRKSLPDSKSRPDFKVLSSFIAQQHSYGASTPERRLQTVAMMQRYPELGSDVMYDMLSRLYQALDFHFKSQAAPMKNYDKRWVIEAIATVKVAMRTSSENAWLHEIHVHSGGFIAVQFLFFNRAGSSDKRKTARFFSREVNEHQHRLQHDFELSRKDQPYLQMRWSNDVVGTR
uniref:Uncharacterized protein n=1 Tax=Lotharella oceanica TaxID=641309 RepID=A0A7S2X9Y6_9EUKA|mmetsp:Transcript_23350/g.43690  ORF Transcript_23350/g.43690 Transcript_23350/m.43690 type:complete len:215 (+) Transcript_23350:29-673(+)